MESLYQNHKRLFSMVFMFLILGFCLPLSGSGVVAICPRLEGGNFLDCSTLGSCNARCSDGAASYFRCQNFRSCGQLCQGTKAPGCDPRLAGETWSCNKYANDCGELVCQGTKPDACPPDAADRPDCEDVYTYCGVICRPAKVKETCAEAWARSGRSAAEALMCDSVETLCGQRCQGEKTPRRCDDPGIMEARRGVYVCETVDADCGVKCSGFKSWEPEKCPGKCPTPPETCPNVCLESEPATPRVCVDLPEGGQECTGGSPGGCKRWGADPNCTPKPAGEEDNYPVGCACHCTPN